MNKLVECVPNFSEGRDKAKVEAIVSAAKSLAGVRVLDVETDADHHRMVLTFVAPPEEAVEAAFRSAKKASELIDLNIHKGEHPRMGAVDVIPFIPVLGVGLGECVRLAQVLGERIARELEIPVYLYGHAAAKPERRDLAVVRKGQFEGLRTAIEADPGRAPDFGPRRVHPTAGAVAVGAREQIINFNANLDLTDIEAGKAIARKIRTSGGGLPDLRAKEIATASGRVQISTVLTNYRSTPISAVLSAIEQEARLHKASIVSTEIVGLVPRDSILSFAVERLKLSGFDPRKQVLEEQLEEAGMGASPGVSWREAARVVSDALSTTDATPGGGSAAAMAGAMACGLAEMALGISLQSKKLDPAARPKLEESSRSFAEARARFLSLCADDAAAFDAFMSALKTPKDDPGRPAAMRKALLRAAEAPMETARAAGLAKGRLAEVLSLAVPAVESDVKCAGHLFRAAVLCAAENVRINAKSFGPEDRPAAEAYEKELRKLISVI